MHSLFLFLSTFLGPENSDSAPEFRPEASAPAAADHAALRRAVDLAPKVRAELGPAGTLDLVCSSGRPFFLLDVRVVAGSASAAPADEDDAADVARGSGAVGEVRIRVELKSSTRLQCEHTRQF